MEERLENELASVDEQDKVVEETAADAESTPEKQEVEETAEDAGSTPDSADTQLSESEPENKEEDKEKQEETKPAPKKRKKRYCIECGALIPPNAKFCPECAHPVPRKKKKKKPISEMTEEEKRDAAKETLKRKAAQEKVEQTKDAAKEEPKSKETSEEKKAENTEEKSGKKGAKVGIAVLVAAILVAGGIGVGLNWNSIVKIFHPDPEPSSILDEPIDTTGTEEEIQAQLDARADASRITASVAPTFQMGEDGWIRTNFVVPEGNNGISERMEVKQNDKIIYSSGILKPGQWEEWVYAPDAVAGRATAIIYPVNKNGEDSGTPINIDVAIF